MQDNPRTRSENAYYDNDDGEYDDDEIQYDQYNNDDDTLSDWSDAMSDNGNGGDDDQDEDMGENQQQQAFVGGESSIIDTGLTPGTTQYALHHQNRASFIVRQSEKIEFRTLGQYLDEWRTGREVGENPNTSAGANGQTLLFHMNEHDHFLAHYFVNRYNGNNVVYTSTSDNASFGNGGSNISRGASVFMSLGLNRPNDVTTTTAHMSQSILSARLRNETSVISESDLVREVIYMLCGISGAVFCADADHGYQFRLVRNVAISGLSIETLNHVLQSLMESACVAKIIDCLKRLLSVKQSSQTIQAFVYSVQCILETLFDDLRKSYDEQQSLNRSSCTLIQLMHLVEPYQNKIRILYELVSSFISFSQSIDERGGRSDKQSKESQFLLSMLYSKLLDLELVPESFNGQYNLLLQLFSQTVTPYLNILDMWMFSACDYADSFSIYYMDPHNEFMIESREEYLANYTDENFWESGYRLKLDSVPIFLRFMGEDVLAVGKSLRMITHIIKLQMTTAGHTNELSAIVQLENSRMSLADIFHQYCRKVLSSNNEKQGNNRAIGQHDTMTNISTEVAASQSNGADMEQQHDSFNALSSTKNNQFIKIKQQSPTSNDIKLFDKQSLSQLLKIPEDMSEYSQWSTDNSITTPSYKWPISSIIGDSLIKEIKRRNQVVCPMLVTKLIKDCKFVHHLVALRSIFLMEAGDVMDHFALKLFEMMDMTKKENVIWDTRDVSSLNNALHESIKIGVIHPRKSNISNSNGTFKSSFDVFRELDLCDALSIHLTCKLDRSNYSEQKFFSSIQMNYHVSEPLNMIINSSSIKCYNEVFVLNLQIKRAKYLLERVQLPKSKRAGDMKRSSTRAIVLHRIQLLSAKLKHFVNNVQHYIMTRVLHSVWFELIDNITQRATMFDQVKQYHAKYIARIQDRCLLRKATFVVNQIHRILELACQLRTLIDRYRWDEPTTATATGATSTTASAGTVSDQQMINGLEYIENEFDKSVTMLISIVNNIIVARGGGGAGNGSTGAHEHLHELHNRLNFNCYYLNT